MHKTIIKSVVLATAITGAQAMTHAPAARAFTVGWHEITQETYPTILPVLHAIKPVYVDAFLNLVNTTIPHLAHGPVERVAPSVATITASLQADWDHRVTMLYTDLLNNRIAIAYLAVAQDNEQTPIGFVLFKQRDIRGGVSTEAIHIDEGSLESIDPNPNAQDQIYVSPIAVKFGLGNVQILYGYQKEPLRA